jgi:hypothetical protein
LTIEFFLEQVPQEFVVDIGIFIILIGLRFIVCFFEIAFRIVDQCDSQAHSPVAFLENRDVLGVGVTAFRGSSPTLTLRGDNTNS